MSRRSPARSDIASISPQRGHHRGGHLLNAEPTDEHHNQLDAARRDLLRTTTQLSALKDQCEELERKLIRTDQLHKTSVIEIEGMEDNNRRLRREAEELKRERLTLSATLSEVTSERDGLQSNLTAALHRTRELEDALEARHQQQLAADAVHHNLIEQHDVAVRHNANLSEQRRKLEEDLRRCGDQLEEQRCVLEAWKHSIAREVDAAASVMERSLARGAANTSSSASVAADEDLSLVSLIGADHSVSVRSIATTTGVISSTPHVDVKPLFTNLYQAFKSLHHFFGQLRKERRDSEDHVLVVRQSCSAAERDVQMLQTENRHLTQRCTQAEVQVTRLTSQVDSACRQAEAATQQHALLLQGVGDALSAPSLDGPSLETQVRLMVAERNQTADRCQHQQTLINELKEELLSLRKSTEERIATIEETSKQQAKHEVAVYEERAVASQQEKRHLLVEAAAQREHAEQIERTLRSEVDALQHQLKDVTTQRDALEPLSRQVPHLEEQIHARDKQLGELRAEYHTLRQEGQSLRSEHQQTTQQLRQECEVLKRHLGPYECSMIGAPPQTSAPSALETSMLHRSNASDSFFTTPVPQAALAQSIAIGVAPTFCSLFDLLIISLRVLHGARKDLAEMSWQRRALSSELNEYNRMFGPLSQQVVTNPSLKRLLQFRRAVVAVLAANRLLRLVREGHGRQREAFWSLRRGFGRVRLTADSSVAVSGGCFGAGHPSIARFASLRHEDRTMRPQDLILPSAAEATDVPALMAALMEQVRVASAPPASAWCRVAPALATCLQGGLQRLYLHYGRPMPFRPTNVVNSDVRNHLDHSSFQHNSSSAASPRRPSLVYPAGMLEAQIASPPSRRQSTQGMENTSTYSVLTSRQGLPPPMSYATAAPTPAAYQGVPQTPYRPQDYSAISTSEYATRSRVLHNTGGGSMMPIAPPHSGGADEFSIEVLNVIRALDNKVAGALRLHHPNHSVASPTSTSISGHASSHRTPKSALKRR